MGANLMSFLRRQAWEIGGVSIAVCVALMLVNFRSGHVREPFEQEIAVAYAALGAWLVIRTLRFLLRVITR